jgi:hypothetical protein
VNEGGRDGEREREREREQERIEILQTEKPKAGYKRE